MFCKTAIEYTCTKFGEDSSGSFPFRTQTNIQTDTNEDPTHAWHDVISGIHQVAFWSLFYLLHILMTYWIFVMIS